jgi:hypothetical protein
MTFAIGSRPGERRASKPPGVFLYAIRLDGDDHCGRIARLAYQRSAGFNLSASISGEQYSEVAQLRKRDTGRGSASEVSGRGSYNGTQRLQRSLMGHLNRSIDGVFEIVRVVGRGFVSIAEVHAIFARVQQAQREPEVARNRFRFLERHG